MSKRSKLRRAAAMPVRKIGKSRITNTGRHPSVKAGRMIAFESALERDLFRLLEANPEIKSFCEQPCTIKFVDAAGKKRSYTPDVRAEYVRPLKHNGRRGYLGEVKSSNFLRRKLALMKPALRAAMKYAHANNLDFHLFTEASLRSPFARNVSFLLHYRDRTVAPGTVATILAAVPSGGIEIQHLVSALSTDAADQARFLTSVYTLVATGRLCANLDVSLAMTTRVGQQERD
jgi:TnsA endonuclease-like protein